MNPPTPPMRHIPRRLVLPCLLTLCLIACGGGGGGGASAQTPSPAPSPTPSNQSVKNHLLATATASASEAAPYGVPNHWSWVAGAVLNTLTLSAPYTHMNFWGAVFRDAQNSTPDNTEVQIAHTSFWVLYEGASQWQKFQGQTPPALGGASFSPQFGPGSGNPILRTTSAGSFVVPYPENIWHYWHGDGFQPSPNTLRAVLVNTQTRLVLRDANGPDDRHMAGYLIHVGADKRNPNDPNCALDQYICPSLGVSKMFRIHSDWRNATFHSLTQADLDAGLPLPPAEIFTLPTAAAITH